MMTNAVVSHCTPFAESTLQRKASCNSLINESRNLHTLVKLILEVFSASALQLCILHTNHLFLKSV